MTDWAPFPDLEAAIIELLSDLVDGNLGVVAPPNLQAACPFIRVTRSGGNNDRITDLAKVDIDCFALARTDATTLGRSVEGRMLSFPHALTSCVIDRVETTQSPSAVPWSNSFVSLFAATYSVTARRTFVPA